MKIYILPLLTPNLRLKVSFDTALGARRRGTYREGFSHVIEKYPNYLHFMLYTTTDPKTRYPRGFSYP